MSSLRIAIIAAFIAAFGIHNASALEIQDGNGNKAAANLADPDDKIPVAHIADDGSMQPSSGFNLQMQGGSSPSSALGFGLTPNSNSSDAFSRAQQRQMQ